MLKREVETGGEYAWQERNLFRSNEYRKVTLLEFLGNPGGKHVLVRDKDGEFETQLQRLIKPWSELGPKEKESEFRTWDDEQEHKQRLAQERDPVGFEIEESWRGLRRFEPGKGGVPRVPEWLPRMLKDMASGVLKLDMGQSGVVEDEQIACYDTLRTMADVCERIRKVAREMLPQSGARDASGLGGRGRGGAASRLDGRERPTPARWRQAAVREQRNHAGTRRLRDVPQPGDNGIPHW